MTKKTRILGLAALGLVIGGAAVALFQIGGPRNLIGMLQYDQRRDGDLQVGDKAPDVALVALDGAARVRLRDRVGPRPLVLVFGSFT